MREATHGQRDDARAAWIRVQPLYTLRARPAVNDRDYAIVVGISTYGALRPQLEGPEIDAGKFAEWLCAADGGDLPKRNVTLIRSSNFVNPDSREPLDYEPTLSQVTKAFAKLFKATADNFGSTPRVGRRIYIYLAGHGLTPRVDPLTSINQSGLLMANCMENAMYENIPGQAYAEWFHLSHSFDEILLFMDCCRTDKSDLGVLAVLPPVVAGGRVNDVQVFYAWATQWDSRAFELSLGSPPARRGVFTYALLEALTIGVPGAQGRLTPESIVGHLSTRVPQLRNGDASQQPQFFPPRPDDRIVIATRMTAPPATNVTLTFAAALIGRQAELQEGSGTFKRIDIHTVDSQPWNLTLAPGTYVVRVDERDIGVVVRPDEAKRQDIA
jgi:hypothetical protein